MFGCKAGQEILDVNAHAAFKIAGNANVERPVS
jgi:hypothetical protein